MGTITRKTKQIIAPGTVPLVKSSKGGKMDTLKTQIHKNAREYHSVSSQCFVTVMVY